ncbi:MAG: FHA domain-containing protein, partial [Isosphaeraceae bacterium]
IVLNFADVERLSSWVVGTLVAARNRCVLNEGGMLKVCGLRPEVSTILRVAGVDGQVEVYPDEAAAVASPWPERRFPRPLPAAMLAGLRERAVVDGKEAAPRPVQPTSDGIDARPVVVRLTVREGRWAGRSLTVRGPRFVIGRDNASQLRVTSPAVSRAHASILIEGGRVTVRDLGSTNGTIVDGRPLRDASAEVVDGSLIRIGPMLLELRLDEPENERLVADVGVDEMIAGWLVPESEAPGGEPDVEEPTTLDDVDAPLDDPGERAFVKHQVIQDVLVVTPVVPALDDEAGVDLLREVLIDLFTQPLPRRVVLNLEYVSRLSGGGIGVLVAHHLRLERAGGSLRICQARARLLASLEQIHLTMLMDCAPTVDEAVLNAWPS